MQGLPHGMRAPPPAVGGLALAHEGLEMTAGPGLTLTVCAAETGSPSEEGLRLLASRADIREADARV
jgi:hypothetical protein